MRILVADDDPLNRDIMGRILTRLKEPWAAAEDGVEALEAARRAVDAGEAFELILLDLSMPRMGGLEAARAIRAAGLPGRLVALTGSDEDMAIYAAGFDGFLQKPITVELMRGLLEKARAGGAL